MLRETEESLEDEPVAFRRHLDALLRMTGPPQGRGALAPPFDPRASGGRPVEPLAIVHQEAEGHAGEREPEGFE